MIVIELLLLASVDDVASVVEVFHRSRAEAMPWLPVLHTPAEDVAFFGGLIGERSCWLIEREGRVVAFVVADDAWIHQLYVEPSLRGTGLGARLVDHVKQMFPNGVDLWVFARNVAAQKFYAAQGFVKVESTDGRRNEERLPDLRMRWAPSVADLTAHGIQLGKERQV